MVQVSATRLLKRLKRVRDEHSVDSAGRKLELLRELDLRRLSKPTEVRDLHEVLSFLHAYPDSRRIRTQVERMLNRFAERSDLRRFANALEDTGIEGTPIYYSFYWSTALWLETKWPGCLSIDWKEFKRQDDLRILLYTLLPFCESLILDESELDPRELLDWLRHPDETDAGFLIRRVAKARADEAIRETIYEELDIPYRLSPGPGTPARTGARYKPSPVVFQTRPLDRSRPDLRKECLRKPRAVRPVSPREGQKLIEMTREAMVTRSRDLYAFQFSDKNDVRLVEFDDGLQFAAFGLLPKQRLMLDSVYGFLTLKNGIPMGYVLSSSYFNSTEVAYNIFDTFRGGEAARVYGRVLAMMRHLFGADAFTVDPYQMGHDNPEGLKSGAWWFYYKLDFRPMDPEVKRLLRSELARMRKNPKHRSSLATLNRLSSKNMFLFAGRPRKDIRGLISLENIALAVSRYIALRYGADRERAMRECAQKAAQLLGVRSFRGFTPDERLAWKRWSPLMLALPGVERWTREEKRALARVARAKGGRRESDYVRLLDSHRKLRRSLLKLAEREHEPV
ncbi:MAG: hypothetical protein JSW58_16400 [Candidatus Latescibacterota bacterium]|nr:MAG: hypothetical protein JSW58_16400 [Candidatus Latescibacterota bacterium]